MANFAEVIQLRVLRLSWITWLAPKCNNNNKCPYKKEAEGDLTGREEEDPCNHGGRNKSDLATSQGMLAATRSQKKQERDSTLDIPEGAQPWPHPGFSPLMSSTDFWHLELWGNKFLLFKAIELLVICYNSHKKWIFGLARGQGTWAVFFLFLNHISGHLVFL